MDKDSSAYSTKKERLTDRILTRMLEIKKEQLRNLIRIMHERDPLMMPSKKLIKLRKENKRLEKRYRNLKKRLDKLA